MTPVMETSQPDATPEVRKPCLEGA